MASQTLNLSITDTSDQLILITRGWTQVWARLESNADGVNEISIGSSFAEIEGGVDTGALLLGPGTEVKIKTTSANPVKWTVILNDLFFLDVFVESFCGGQ
jgi:hypothetical protein